MHQLSGVQTIENSAYYIMQNPRMQNHQMPWWSFLCIPAQLPYFNCSNTPFMMSLIMNDLALHWRIMGLVMIHFFICNVLFFLESSSLKNSSWNKIFRHVGGKQKEDNIIVWFRVRKWACEEERENARFDIARSKQHILISESPIQASSLYIMFGLQEPLLVDEWISCWAATYKETHVTSTQQNICSYITILKVMYFFY